MKDERSLVTAPYDGGEVKSALAEMLKKSLPDVAASDKSNTPKEAAMGDGSLGYVVAVQTPSKSPSKARSLSDSTPKLSPSPKIKEHPRKSQDDQNVLPTATPRTPRRPEFLARGLSLQMPPRDVLGIASPTSTIRAPPLSPRVDKSEIYASPGSVLPRHSRGLDFSRACTNLHHSTLAESSPDSSPTITQKGMMIPSRKMSINAMAIDPPAFGHWAQVPASEKSVVSSSLGSVNMLGSDSGSSSDDDLDPMEPDENEDVIVSTPQVLKRNIPSATTPFTGASWAGPFSPGGTNFPNFHRQRLRNRSRKSSSSASGHSSLASPVPQSPPASKMSGDGYFAREIAMRGPASRRESLSMHTHDLHISSGNDSGDEASKAPATTPGVVRRAVTRRGNLLPKTRAFGRIRAELLEETMPVDAEVKREAEVIRQVRESDGPDVPRDSITASSSPTMQAIDSLADALQDIPEDSTTSLEGGNGTKGLFGAFARQSNSGNGGKEYWNNFENQHKTPPPPSFFPRVGSSTIMSDEMSMDSPVLTTPVGSVFPWALPSKESTNSNNENSRASTPQPMGQPNTINPPTAADGIRKANKRRRDDDLDVASMKRRAVSPGVSVGNSPILSQSPSQRSDLWGQPLKPTQSNTSTTSASGHAAGERSNSNGSVAQTPLLGPKRVGLQGMNDMQGLTEKMSIE